MRTVTISLVLLTSLLAACGSVHDRGGCSASTDCPAGQYCARTGDGNVCWADAVPPAVSAVTVTCLEPVGAGSTCLRDGVLRVQATITDDKEVLGAEVALDVGGAPVPMIRASGDRWIAEVQLRQLPFDYFEHAVVTTVTARDGARSTVGASALPLHVTRVRWAFDAGALISVPAVMRDGTAVVGVVRNSHQVLAVRPDGTKRWDATAGSRVVTAAPTIGSQAIWVADDRNIVAIDPVLLTTLAGVGVALDGATTNSLAAKTAPASEWAFVGSASGRLGGASATALEYDRTSLGDACTAGPVISQDGGTVFVATRNVTSNASVRSYAFDGAISPNWAASVGVNVTAPLAVDADGAVWSASQDAKLVKTVPSAASGDPVPVATLAGSGVDSPVILAGGDVIVGDASGSLHRYSRAGVSRWSTEPNLESPPLAPIVITGGPASLVVPTTAGRLYALRGDGSTAWWGQVDGAGLRGANIHSPAGTSLSTVYLSGEGGVLYAVIVDGVLDTSAPWPKAFHDPQNTNRAGAQP